MSVDDATWALSVALITLPYYQRPNPMFAALATLMIEDVLAEEFGE